MADVWKIGQDMKAEEFYNKAGKKGPAIFDATARVVSLTNTCIGMSRSYEQTIQDQNNYLLEIDDQLDEIENLQKELEAKVKAQTAEKEKLVKSAGDKGLPDEDKAKIDEINDEINTLTGETNTKIEGLNGNIKAVASKSKYDLNKADIATDYGSTTIEKGQQLTEAKAEDYSGGWERMFYNLWDEAGQRKAGEKAVEAGNNLFNQINISSDIEKEINQKTRVLK